MAGQGFVRVRHSCRYTDSTGEPESRTRRFAPRSRSAEIRTRLRNPVGVSPRTFSVSPDCHSSEHAARSLGWPHSLFFPYSSPRSLSLALSHRDPARNVRLPRYSVLPQDRLHLPGFLLLSTSKRFFNVGQTRSAARLARFPLRGYTAYNSSHIVTTRSVYFVPSENR